MIVNVQSQLSAVRDFSEPSGSPRVSSSAAIDADAQDSPDLVVGADLIESVTSIILRSSDDASTPSSKVPVRH